MEAQEVWEKIKSDLLTSSLVNADLYNKYIGNSKALGFNDNNLIIEVVNELSKSILEGNMDIFQEIFKKNNLENFKPFFVININKKAKTYIKPTNEKTKNLKDSKFPEIQSFDNFVCGDSNKEAFVACQQIAQDLGNKWNPTSSKQQV